MNEPIAPQTANQTIALGIGAGLTAALLQSSLATGSVLGLLVSFFAPLPLFIVGFGWHPLLAVLGGSVAGLVLVWLFGSALAIAFSLQAAIPAVLVAALVWQRGGRLPPPVLVGLITLIAAGYAFLVVFGSTLLLHPDFDALQAALRRNVEASTRAALSIPAEAPLVLPAGGDLRPVVEVLAQAVLPLSALGTALGILIQAYLGGRVVERSGRLWFAWPPVWSLALPKLLLPVSAVVLLLTSQSGHLGLAADIAALLAVLLLTLLGYATIHALSRATGFRVVLLWTLWLSTILFVIPAVVALLVGIVELAFNLRQTAARRGPPHLS
jgi:hypothetical protein